MAIKIWRMTKGQVTPNDFLTEADIAGETEKSLDASAQMVTGWRARRRRSRT
jgi:hypothetical protein